MEGMITLTKKEQRINDVMVKLISKEFRTSDAVRLLGLSERQVYRKKRNFIKSGISSVVHKNKGRASNKKLLPSFIERILKLYKEEYFDFNFHHFNDILEDEYNISVSDSLIYNLLTTNGVTSPNAYRKRKKSSHPPRDRRSNAGELIQVDASKHLWFNNDENYYHLHGGIDDATGIVVGAFFTKEETIFGYQMLMKQIITNYGIPQCLYSDYRTVFQSTKKELTLEEELSGKEIKNTRFGDVLDHIGTDIISTSNPMAKGRIERLWRTFQDRLLKELKKKNINTMEKANQYLEDVFLPKYNSRFALQINDNKNYFVKPDNSFDINIDLATFKEYKVHNHCYLTYDKSYRVILDGEIFAYIDTKEKVKVYTFLDGSVNVLFKGKYYPTKAVQRIVSDRKIYTPSMRSLEEINASKSHTQENTHPWISAQKRKFERHKTILDKLNNNTIITDNNNVHEKDKALLESNLSVS